MYSASPNPPPRCALMAFSKPERTSLHFESFQPSLSYCEKSSRAAFQWLWAATVTATPPTVVMASPPVVVATSPVSPPPPPLELEPQAAKSATAIVRIESSIVLHMVMVMVITLHRQRSHPANPSHPGHPRRSRSGRDVRARCTCSPVRRGSRPPSGSCGDRAR